MLNNVIYITKWLSYGALWNGTGSGGLYCFNGLAYLGHADWGLATISDAIWMFSNLITIVEWRSYGILTFNNDPDAGISCLLGNLGIDASPWDTATNMLFI